MASTPFFIYFFLLEFIKGVKEKFPKTHLINEFLNSL